MADNTIIKLLLMAWALIRIVVVSREWVSLTLCVVQSVLLVTIIYFSTLILVKGKWFQFSISISISGFITYVAPVWF